MSKIIYQFAHGVLIAGEKRLNEPSVNRNLSLEEMPANPFASDVQDDTDASPSQDDSAPKSESPNTPEEAPVAQTVKAEAKPAAAKAAK